MSSTEVWNYANTIIVLPMFPFVLVDLYTITNSVITMLYVTKRILITHFYGCKTSFQKRNQNSQYWILTYLLTLWCRVLLEKLTGLQLVKKFPAFYGTRRFITALTSLRHSSLSWASPVQSIYPHTTSWRSFLILTTHLLLGLPSGLFPSGFPTKTLYAPLTSPIRSTCPAHLILNTRIYLLFNQQL